MLSLRIRNWLRILKSILLKVAKIWLFPQTQDGGFCAIRLFVDWFGLDEATLGMFYSVLMLGIYYTLFSIDIYCLDLCANWEAVKLI